LDQEEEVEEAEGFFIERATESDSTYTRVNLFALITLVVKHDALMSRKEVLAW
jgi:hypothetical protein